MITRIGRGALACAVVALVGASVLLSPGAAPPQSLVVALTFVVPGWLIAREASRNPLGWLLLAVAALFGGIAFCSAAYEAGWAGAAWYVWFTDRVSAFVVPCTAALLLLVPDGHLPSRRWRPVATVVIAAQALAVTCWALLEGPAAAPDTALPGTAGMLNPVGVLPDRLGSLDWLLLWPMLVVLPSVVVRYRRPSHDERPRLTTLLVAIAVFVVLTTVGDSLGTATDTVLDTAAGAVLAAALTSALLRNRLPGVELVLSHLLVYGALSLAIALGYVGVTGLLSALDSGLPRFGSGLVAAVIALLLVPLRGRLQGAVDRAMYGDAKDPLTAVRRMATSTSEAATLDEVLTSIADSVRASLRAPWAGVSAADRTAASGTRPSQGETIAVAPLEVVLGPGRRARPADHALVRELAGHAERVARVVLLADELHASRQQLVTGREEERLRLRRDLHDQLGPTLAGLTMQLGGLSDLLRTDLGAAEAQAVRLESAARQALEDVRRISRGLRPPALDDLGLVGALTQVAERAGLRLTTTSSLAPLPPAVEVAAYRLTAEALTNASRHSGSRDVELDLASDDQRLRVVVRDHGCGINGSPAGVGLLSMRERAEELGGELVIESRDGTTVRATIPLGAGT